MSETTPLIKAALNLRVGVGFDVYRVRKYAAEMPLNEAVELAITECINEGILTEFLQHNRAEVYKVSIFEYDKEKEEKKLSYRSCWRWNSSRCPLHPRG